MKKQRQWKLKASKIPGTENFYVTSDGRVFSTEKGFLVELHLSKAENGYLRVQVVKNGTRQWQPVHRLVLQACSNAAPKEQVNHKNGDKTDNRLENLEWVTPEENRRHSIEQLGHTFKGTKNPSSKITEEDVRFIRQSSLTPKELAEKFGITREAIYAINNRRTWLHVD
jgi:hypothetical protein